jgi:hypothetical protein
MKIVDNFLPKFAEIKRYALQAEYKQEIVINKDFHLAAIPKHIHVPIYNLIEKRFFSNKIIPKTCFFRLSTPDIDTDTRIHTDQNHCNYVGVLYLTENCSELNGTAFWDHPKYGNSLYLEAKAKKIDNVNEYEGKDESIWSLNTVVGARENRLLLYPSNMFHSRYPFKSLGKRIAAIFFWYL